MVWAEAGDPTITIANVSPGLAIGDAEVQATQVAQCSQAQGFDPFQLAAVATPDPGLWALTMTSNDGDAYQSLLVPVACRNGSGDPMPCGGAPSCDDGILEDASDLTVAVFQPDGSSSTLSAIGFAGETDSGNWVSLIQVQRTTGSGAAESLGDPVVLGRAMSEDEAPHSHRVAVLDNQLLAATWIEPNPDGDDTVRIRRYQICTPEDE